MVLNLDKNDINSFFVCEICGKSVSVFSHIKMCDNCIDDYAKQYSNEHELGFHNGNLVVFNYPKLVKKLHRGVKND